MTMFEIPKMATHPLDKYRNANIDYISGSDISLTGNLYVKGAISGSVDMSNDAITAAYVTGSIQVSGSTIFADRITSQYISGSKMLSGASVWGKICGPISGSAKGVLLLSTQSGSITHGLGATPTFMSMAITGSPANMYRDITLTWYPVGTATCYICQSGSGAVEAIGISWKAEV